MVREGEGGERGEVRVARRAAHSRPSPLSPGTSSNCISLCDTGSHGCSRRSVRAGKVLVEVRHSRARCLENRSPSATSWSSDMASQTLEESASLPSQMSTPPLPASGDLFTPSPPAGPIVYVNTRERRRSSNHAGRTARARRVRHKSTRRDRSRADSTSTSTPTPSSASSTSSISSTSDTSGGHGEILIKIRSPFVSGVPPHLMAGAEGLAGTSLGLGAGPAPLMADSVVGIRVRNVRHAPNPLRHRHHHHLQHRQQLRRSAALFLHSAWTSTQSFLKRAGSRCVTRAREAGAACCLATAVAAGAAWEGLSAVHRCSALRSLALRPALRPAPHGTPSSRTLTLFRCFILALLRSVALSRPRFAPPAGLLALGVTLVLAASAASDCCWWQCILDGGTLLEWLTEAWVVTLGEWASGVSRGMRHISAFVLETLPVVCRLACATAGHVVALVSAGALDAPALCDDACEEARAAIAKEARRLRRLHSDRHISSMPLAPLPLSSAPNAVPRLRAGCSRTPSPPRSPPPRACGAEVCDDRAALLPVQEQYAVNCRGLISAYEDMHSAAGKGVNGGLFVHAKGPLSPKCGSCRSHRSSSRSPSPPPPALPKPSTLSLSPPSPPPLLEDSQGPSKKFARLQPERPLSASSRVRGTRRNRSSRRRPQHVTVPALAAALLASEACTAPAVRTAPATPITPTPVEDDPAPTTSQWGGEIIPGLPTCKLC